MKTHLKIKIASLAAEAKIIKANERKWKAAPRKGSADPHPMFFSLQGHRLGVVRPEARCSLLAYGFLRGRRYRQLEAKCHPESDEAYKQRWNRVQEIVARFSGGDKRDIAQRLTEWKDVA